MKRKNRKRKADIHEIYYESPKDHSNTTEADKDDFEDTWKLAKAAIGNMLWLSWHIVLFVLAGIIAAILLDDSIRRMFLGMFSL